MNPRPLCYLKNLREASVVGLQRIAQLGWPLLVSANELQRSGKDQELLAVLREQGAEIFSQDVDNQTTDLQLIIQGAREKKYTHLLVVDCWREDWLVGLEKLPQHLHLNPCALIPVISEATFRKKPNALMDRLFDLGDKDYRNLYSTCSVYPLSIKVMSAPIKTEKNFAAKTLVRFLRHRENVAPLVIAAGECPTPQPAGGLSAFYSSWLIALSSLHNGERPVHGGISFAVGAMIACSPFYGLQTILIIAACVIFRLSFPVAFLGSQVSLPPFYSVLVPLELAVGFWIFGEDLSLEGPWLELAQQHFSSWMIGYLVVGGTLSIAMGIFWYVLQNQLCRRKKAEKTC